MTPPEFWDTSALTPVFAPEAGSVQAQAASEATGAISIWWTTPTEIGSGIERKVREGRLSRDEADAAKQAVLSSLTDGELLIVEPTEEVRRRSLDLLARHPLRAADALQLAAALRLGEPNLVFRAEDRRLREAAEAEGLSVPAPFSS